MGLCVPPVRVEGCGDFEIPHYLEEVFKDSKEHFRLGLDVLGWVFSEPVC